MGPKTAIGDTLSLVWIEPDLLRVYCSKVGSPGPGEAYGDIRDATLVSLLFKGFLGLEPRRRGHTRPPSLVCASAMLASAASSFFSRLSRHGGPRV